MKKRLFILCLVTLILSACETSSTVEPIASVLDQPGHVEYIEAYTSYSCEYTPADVRHDITVTDTTFTFHPFWLENALEINASDKEDIKINGYSLLWCEEQLRAVVKGEHTIRYSESDDHGYVAYTLRLPLTKASKQEIYGELYKQLRRFFKKLYSSDEIVLDTKTDFKRVIETDTPFADFDARWRYLWIEHSDLQFVIMNYYTQSQSSIDDFYYDD